MRPSCSQQVEAGEQQVGASGAGISENVNVHKEVECFESRFTAQSIAVAEQRIASETDHRFYRIGLPGQDGAINVARSNPPRVSRRAKRQLGDTKASESEFFW